MYARIVNGEVKMKAKTINQFYILRWIKEIFCEGSIVQIEFTGWDKATIEDVSGNTATVTVENETITLE